MKRTSRPPNIAVGSTIVRTPRSELLVVAIGPLGRDGLVAEADVLVAQHDTQLVGLDGALHGLHL
jgi:hypothetical protein